MLGDLHESPPKEDLTSVSSVRLPGMRFVSRLLPVLFAMVALLVLAPAAMAADGVGVYGRTDDKVVTFFAFGLIAFFAILVTVLSLIQIRLENRKERRTQDLERLGSR
jgi:putative copper export protein